MTKLFLLLILLPTFILHAAPTAEQTIFTLSPSLQQSLTLQRNQSLSQLPAADVEKLIQQNLLQAKKTQNPSLALYSIHLYKQLSTEQLTHSVQLQYADTLQYVHEFDKALAVLEFLFDDPVISENAYLMAIPIYLYKGQYTTGFNACRQISHLLLNIICKQWLGSLAQIHNQSQAIKKLNRLLATNTLDVVAVRWAQEALIDLLMLQQDTPQVLAIFAQRFDQEEQDLYVTEQVLDYLLIHQKIEQLQQVIEEYQLSTIFPVHHSYALQQSLSLKQLSRYQDYEQAQLISNYFELALYYFREQNYCRADYFLSQGKQATDHVLEHLLQQQLNPYLAKISCLREELL